MPQLADPSAAAAAPWSGDPDPWLRWFEWIRYLALAVSVLLLALALGFLARQAYRCCASSARTKKANSDLLKDQRSRPQESFARGAQVCRLSHCLSQGLVPPPELNQTPVQKAAGSLRFSVDYDAPRCQLAVTVLRAEGLPANTLRASVRITVMWATRALSDRADDEDGRGDPVLWAALHQWQTRLAKGGRSLSFGERFCCTLRGSATLRYVSLKMEVRDFDTFSRQTVLGEVRVPLQQLTVSSPVEMLQDLQQPRKDLVGQVLLSLKFLPTSQRLEIGVLKVRTALAEKRSDAASFVKVGVQYNRCKLRSQTTSTVACSLVTVFNDLLLFSLPELQLQQCKVVVSVYNTYATERSARHLVGQFTVGRDHQSEDEHWHSMMHSIRQPVARWHGVLI